MIKRYAEKVESNFDGTIIDLETTGEFCNYYSDSRRYKDIIPVICGCIDRGGIRIVYAENRGDIQDIKKEITQLFPSLAKPFSAFNCNFEQGVLFHFVKSEISFEREINSRKYERKEDIVQTLGIASYGDPFHGNGLQCSDAWKRGDVDKAVAHNRSCLLKERDILLERGHRTPDTLRFVDVSEE